MEQCPPHVAASYFSRLKRQKAQLLGPASCFPPSVAGRLRKRVLPGLRLSLLLCGSYSCQGHCDLPVAKSDGAQGLEVTVGCSPGSWDPRSLPVPQLSSVSLAAPFASATVNLFSFPLQEAPGVSTCLLALNCVLTRGNLQAPAPPQPPPPQAHLFNCP